jgi:hypothetical protein
MESVFSYSDDVLYTIHWVLLLFKRGKVYELERRSFTMMMLHILSGYNLTT